MGNEDWYARKLNQPQPARRDSTPPVQFAPMRATPPGQPVYQPPMHPEQQGAQPQGRFDIDAYWASLETSSQEGLDARRQALINAPKPGAGNRAAKDCPNCGGHNFFPRDATSGIRRGNAHPAPQCYDCGYPLVQSGSIGGAGVDGWSTQ